MPAYFFSILFLLSFFAALAKAGEEQATQLPVLEIKDIFVDDLQNLSAPKKISRQRLLQIQTTDVGRVLKELPGVYSRDEDGHGLRPNIGLRGTNPDRSKKIVILEDDVLIGPAPYSAPAAYYTPSLLIADSLEIYKGFAALPYGPNSVGGAVQYSTPQFGVKNQTVANVNYGSFNTAIIKISTEQKISDSNIFLKYGRISSDGFKKIDTGEKTGFVQDHFLFKIQRPIQFLNNDQLLEFRFGYGNEKSKETYLGLSEIDFNNSYLRRYSSSSLDEMQWQHLKFQLEHLVDVSSKVSLKSTMYRHQFKRTWYRLDGFRDQTQSIQKILSNTSGAAEPYFNILNGTSNSSDIGLSGDLILANNERQYLSEGLLSVANLNQIWSDNIDSKSKIRFLLHQDQIQRLHDADTYSMQNQKLVRTTDPRSITARNQDKAVAASISFQDEIKWSQWLFSPQFRYENVQFKFKNDLLQTAKNRSDEIFLGGLGFVYDFTANLKGKSAVNQAATLAGLDSLGNESREQSLNKEVGIAYQSEVSGQQVDLIYFQNDYKNLVGTCTTSTGCVASALDQQFNGGAAVVKGIEFRYAKGFRFDKYFFPVQVNYTQIQAEFLDTFNSTNSEWGLGQIKSGDPLPYVPLHQFSIIFGVEKNKFKHSIVLNHNGKSYDQSAEVDRIEIPSYGVIDYSVGYEMGHDTLIHIKIDNVLSKKYISAARPFGFRPGKPQMISANLSYKF